MSKYLTRIHTKSQEEQLLLHESLTKLGYELCLQSVINNGDSVHYELYNKDGAESIMQHITRIENELQSLNKL